MKPAHAALADSAPKIAVILPCYNEGAAIARTVATFQATLPGADIYVYDNNSRDDTATVAAAAGAIVRREPRQGKGNVVRRMFADIEADIYVLADGDSTYDASAAPGMIEMLRSEDLDMVAGTRHSPPDAQHRRGHQFGNKLFTGFLAFIFGRTFTDILTGYRVFSRRFVKTFPSLSSGFEIETEISVHALSLRMPVGEVETRYAERPDGSVSKLNTYRDGWRILKMMLALFRQERPALFFAIASAALIGLSLALAVPLIVTFLKTGLVPRLPTAILCTGLVILAMLSLACGLILDTVTHGRREIRRLSYLSVPGPRGG